MSNTVITNYTDLNGPSTKAESSVVVIVNKDGSLSVDQNLLGTLMGTDGSQGAGISVVRVGHEGKPDDATDSESDDDKVPHVTMSVDSYYNEPNSIIKYDSGAEMLQSLRIETRENSLLGFQNDHCYTLLTSPSQTQPQTNETYKAYEEPKIEITHDPPPKPVPSSKKITILEQQIIPKGKKIILNPAEPSIVLKGNDVLSKPLLVINKHKSISIDKKVEKTDENVESSSISSSGDSIPDRDSDSDYKDVKDRSTPGKTKKTKPRILKATISPKVSKIDPKVSSRLKSNRSLIKKEIKEKIQQKTIGLEKKQHELKMPKEMITVVEPENVPAQDPTKIVSKQTPKPLKKEKKTPSHVSALLSDMTSLFSTPDVIRRVSTDTKQPTKPEKEQPVKTKVDSIENKLESLTESGDRLKTTAPKTYSKLKISDPPEKVPKSFDLMPQLDDASLAQILQDSTSTIPKSQPSITSANINSPSWACPLSPTLDLLGGLQPEEEGLTVDMLLHVAQLVESSENLQEVIDKQVLGKVDPIANKQSVQQPLTAPTQDVQTGSLYTPPKSVKNTIARKDPIEIVRKDGRVITLPPIEAPATRSSKRKSQIEPVAAEIVPVITPAYTDIITPDTQAQIQHETKQFINKKVVQKKAEPTAVQAPITEKFFTESQDSWNSEDDPYRLWCICRQPHNNRFMICCDSCEDWFHGKCVNITKAMGQQMEEQGIEWRCPNCVKKTKAGGIKTPNKPLPQKKLESEPVTPTQASSSVSVTDSKTTCIVCKKPARPSSIYCSDACILKHAQDSLSSQTASTKVDSDTGKPQDKNRMESRVIVYERKSGRLLAGPNAPTAENLKAWLQKNPTFEVVRPGTLSAIKPMISNKKKGPPEPGKIQTTLNFERIPKKSADPTTPKTPESKLAPSKPLGSEPKQQKVANPKVVPSLKEEVKTPPPKIAQPKTPVVTRSQQLQLQETPKQSISRLDTPRPSRSQDGPRMNMIKLIDTPKPGPSKQQDTPKPSTSKAVVEPKKPARLMSRSQSSLEKAATVSPSTSRRKDSSDNRRMDSTEPIRENVRKALQEQMTLRMAESKKNKLSEAEIQQFALDTELELYELFSKDVGMKYKAKYRSLMFNIKDRKNLSLWQKICDGEITPKQLVRLSPEELASQELAQWRDKEAKHQLELIKKSELDLLAASKTYVLKTHKGEEVMETKESVSTELDPNLAVEDLVTALNDSSGVQIDSTVDTSQEISVTPSKPDTKKHSRGKESSKKSSRESKRESDNRKQRSRRSDTREQRSTRRSEKNKRDQSVSKGRSKSRSKDKESERSRRRSRSRVKSRRRSKSRDRSSSESQGRDRSISRSRSKRRSSRDSRRKERSRSKRRSSDDKKTRSKSQEVSKKSKNDSTDSEQLERPKSAMLKEVHPEYDPHEPMITSALSEEDLRKDSFEESFKADVSYNEAYYDPKAFSIDPILASPKHSGKQDKLSEAESDQEPTSTVESSVATVWNGCINMVDVARFYVATHEVSGTASDLEEDLAAELDIVGRIKPETVWEYIGKMKRTSNKDIVILRLQAANDEEQMQYIALYSYLSSRNRLGVVKVSNTATVKDFYIVPLPVNTPVPPVLLPFDGPGLGEVKTHLLIAIIIRQRRKRLAANLPKEVVPAKVVRESRKRSYTPPPVKGFTPPSSPRRKQSLTTYTSPALSTSVKDKIAATLASAADDDEPYSPGSSTSSGSAAPHTLKTKMDELNRQIEEQKLQIMQMARADSSVAEDEAYSPSRPMTPPTPVMPLSDIALPSNLQEILATIKQRENTSDVDMRTLPPP